VNFNKKYLFIVIILQLFNFTAIFSQDILPKEVKKAVVEGNSKKLAVFFNKNIELSIKNKEDIYSKAQAQLIIKDFFKKHKPNYFKVIFEGKLHNLHYAICNLKTSSKSFNVYILYQIVKNKAVIQKLEIK